MDLMFFLVGVFVADMTILALCLWYFTRVYVVDSDALDVHPRDPNKIR